MPEIRNQDILDYVELLDPSQTRAVENFLDTPDFQAAIGIRNKLLREQDAVTTRFTYWNILFRKFPAHRRNEGEWKEFNKRVTKGSGQELVSSIVALSKLWGKEIVKHYGWNSRGPHYCNKLRTVALKFKQWSKVVVLFNQSILQRISGHQNDRRIPSVEGPNSIALWDLQRIIEETSFTKTFCQQNDVPDGYGLDQHGLIVQVCFAKISPPQGSVTPASCDNDGSIVISTPPLVSNSPAVPLSDDYANSLTTTVATESSPLCTTPFHSASSVPQGLGNVDVLFATKQPSQAAIVAFNSPVDNAEITTDPTRSLLTSPSTNPAISPPRSLFHHENQTLTATSNCNIDGATKCTVARLLLANASPQVVGKRHAMSHDSSPRKASPVDGDLASALVTPLRPVSPASIGDEDDEINENGDQEGEVDAYTETNFSTVGLVSSSAVSPQPQDSPFIEQSISTTSLPLLFESMETFIDKDTSTGGYKTKRLQLNSETRTALKKKKLSHPDVASQSTPSLRKSAWLKDAKSSLNQLVEGERLNDAIINACIHILAIRHRFCFFNSHFLLQSGPPISWKRKAEYGDPLQSDLVLIPIYENDHWYLLVMFKSDTGNRAQKDRVVCFLDPLESTSRSYERTFTYWTWYLSDLGYRGAVHRKQITVPQQLNVVDCGVFSIAFAYQIADNRQRFVNAVESGTGLDWTIDAPKWRIYIRSELEPTYDDSSATLNYKSKNARDGNDDARIEVVSACHALEALPKASKQALPSATIASSVDAAVDQDLTMGHNMTMASVLAASSPPESPSLLKGGVTIDLANPEISSQATTCSRYSLPMSPEFAKSSMPSLTPISPPFQYTPVQITAEREEQASQKEAASQDSDKPLSHPVFTSSSLNTTAAALFEAFSVLSREKIERLRAANPQNLTEDVQKALDWIFQHALCFRQGYGYNSYRKTGQTITNPILPPASQLLAPLLAPFREPEHSGPGNPQQFSHSDRLSISSLVWQTSQVASDAMGIQHPRPQPLPVPSANLEMASAALNRSRQGKSGILSSPSRQDDTSSMKIGAVVNCTSGDLLTSTASKGHTSTFNIPESFSNATILNSDQHADFHSAQVKLPPNTDLSAPPLKDVNPDPTPEATSSSLPNCLTYAVRPEALMRATGEDDLWIMLTVPHNGDPPFAEYFRFGYHLSQLVEEPTTCLLQ